MDFFTPASQPPSSAPPLSATQFGYLSHEPKQARNLITLRNRLELQPMKTQPKLAWLFMWAVIEGSGLARSKLHLHKPQFGIQIFLLYMSP